MHTKSLRLLLSLTLLAGATMQQISAVESNLTSEIVSLTNRQLIEKGFEKIVAREDNCFIIRGIKITFSQERDAHYPFEANTLQQFTIDIQVGAEIEKLQSYLTPTLGSTTHRLGLLGTCWHLNNSNWQVTYRDANARYKNYSSHTQIKPHTPLQFYCAWPTTAGKLQTTDNATFSNFVVGLVIAAAGLEPATDAIDVDNT